MSCMFCKRKGKIFNVYQNYGNTDNTIRDDILEFFGSEVENYLNSDDFVCNVCMNMLDIIAKLKRRLWSIICNPGEVKYALKLGKFCDVFASLKFDDEDFDADIVNQCRTPVSNICRTPTPTMCRTPTPSELVDYKYSIPYDTILENAIAERERYRSQSRASSKYKSDASTNDEVESIFKRKKRRKKRGHNFTHRKSHRRAQSAMTHGSRPRPRSIRPRTARIERDRSISPLTDGSYTSSYESRSKKRRSFYRDYNQKTTEEDKKLLCDYQCCTLNFENLDVLTAHKIIDHNCLALYVCDECNNRYTTETHLKLHERLHDNSPYFCIMCGAEIENKEKLQAHLTEHLICSVACSYCDLYFLSKKSCEEHVSSNHYHKSKKLRKPRKSRFIMERISSSADTIDTPESEYWPTKHYEARILILDRRSDDNSPLVDGFLETSSGVRVDVGNEQSALNERCGLPDTPESNISKDSPLQIGQSPTLSNSPCVDSF